MFAFIFGLLLINMWLVENVDWTRSSGAVLEFVKGRKTVHSPSKHDEESTDQLRATNGINTTTPQSGSAEKLTPAGSTFTWRGIGYTVPYQGGDKQLLEDVSGYCEPGNLTALVGASGAGKSTRKWFPELLFLWLRLELTCAI